MHYGITVTYIVLTSSNTKLSFYVSSRLDRIFIKGRVITWIDWNASLRKLCSEWITMEIKSYSKQGYESSVGNDDN